LVQIDHVLVEPPNAKADRKVALSAVPPINDEIETEKSMDTSVVVSEDVKYVKLP
jgi:hypothetical protein